MVDRYTFDNIQKISFVRIIIENDLKIEYTKN
jgi:hypothetical protein